MGEGYIDPNKMYKVEMHSASMSITILLTKWQMLMVTGMYKMVIDNCPDKKSCISSSMAEKNELDTKILIAL